MKFLHCKNKQTTSTPRNIPKARIWKSWCKKPYGNVNLATNSPGSYQVKLQGVSSDQSTKRDFLPNFCHVCLWCTTVHLTIVMYSQPPTIRSTLQCHFVTPVIYHLCHWTPSTDSIHFDYLPDIFMLQSNLDYLDSWGLGEIVKY